MPITHPIGAIGLRVTTAGLDACEVHLRGLRALRAFVRASCVVLRPGYFDLPRQIGGPGPDMAVS